MILPFILQRCLHSGDIKNNNNKRTASFIPQGDVIKKLIRTWAIVAKVSKKTFSNTILRSEDYNICHMH